MLAVCVITLLCLVSVSHSAPLVCEDFRPLDQLHHLKATWVLVAGSMNTTAEVEEFKRRDSASITFVNETSQMSFTRTIRFGDSCEYVYINITFEGSRYIFHPENLTVTLLHTLCPDCLVMYLEDESMTDTRLYLFSKRRVVDQKEMEDFKAQVECFNLPPPLEMDPNKELCPEHISKNPAAQTKEEAVAQEAEQTHDVSDLS